MPATVWPGGHNKPRSNIAYTDPNGNVLSELSPAQLFYCGGSNGCLNGWYPSAAFQYAERAGVVPESCFPYTPGDQFCNLCNYWQDSSPLSAATPGLEILQ
ncbi:C1 family peptidase [Micromonospora sp. ATCC 39149]|uniref:C1 family peptidase n=1 Tax=Micromonospora sp. (strain ATCC 39149 / NRRL 15099 / SCC 1413) TaxID=219305 RepID=UPI00210175C0|nr:C1 family peptidase [Micromonospora sp. ATCC 39149]